MNTREPVLSAVLVALVAAALAATPAPPPVEAVPEDGQVTYVLERTTSAESNFNLNVSAIRGTGQETFIGLAGLVGQGPELEVHPSLMAFGSGEPGVEAYVAGNRVGCPNQGCGVVNQASLLGASASYDSEEGGPALDRFLIVVESEHEVAIEVEATGWELRRVDLDFQTVRQEDVEGAVSVYAAGNGYEMFTHASYDSPFDGSIAMADLPCAGVLGTAFGPSVGSVTLDGGREPVEGTCIAQASAPIGAIADEPTLWTLEGQAVGSTSQHETRLAVITVPPTPSCDESRWIGCDSAL